MEVCAIFAAGGKQLVAQLGLLDKIFNYENSTVPPATAYHDGGRGEHGGIMGCVLGQ